MKKIVYLSVFLFSVSANAGSLNGDTVFQNNFFLSPGSAVVGNEVEFTGSIFGTDTWEADFQDDFFTLRLSTTTRIAGSARNWRFTDLDFSNGGYITDVQLIDFLGTSFDNPEGISFTDHSVSYTMERFSLDANTNSSAWGTFKITTAIPVTVSEPGLLSLLGLGLASFGFSRKRKAAK